MIIPKNKGHELSLVKITGGKQGRKLYMRKSDPGHREYFQQLNLRER